MKAIHLLEHFLFRADWVDRETTVDKIIVGDPEKDVQSALVTWISSFAALRTAAERGFDVLVTHEPTFYSHRNELDTVDESDIALRKKGFTEESGLVIVRIHDCWDRWPEVGIPWAWARFLELGERPAAFGNRKAQHRYDIPPITVEELAKRIARKTGTIGEASVQVVGDGAREVSRVGIGTGCICGIAEYIEMGCEVSVVCDDGASYWSRIQPAEDMDHPVIRVNHGTSEEPGMVTLTRYINDNLPGVTAEHLPHGCCFRLVGA